MALISSSDKPPYDVACPRVTCQAAAGLPCVGQHQGHEKPVPPHPERITASEQASR